MEGTGKWITGAAVGLLAFVGLLAASRAQDSAFYWGGIIVAAGCVAYIFWMINHHYDRLDAAHGGGNSAGDV